MKRFWIAVCIVALFAAGAVFLMNSNTLVQAQVSTINLSVDPATTKAGAAFEVPVKMTIPKDLPVKGWQFELNFDPKLLRLNGVKQGDLFRRCLSADRVFFFLPFPIDNKTGKVMIVEAGMGGPDWAGCTGSGVIAVLDFTALGKGTPTYMLSKIELADASGPQSKAYKLFQYSVNGALRQNVDQAKLAAQIQKATQAQEDYLNSSMYKRLHYTPSAAELAAATKQAYRMLTPFQMGVEPTPVLFAFQSAEDILNAIPNAPYFYPAIDRVQECADANSPGTPVFVKALDPDQFDYYLIPFYYLDGTVCGVATFTLYQDGKGYMGGLNSAPWKTRENPRNSLPPITADEAVRLVEKAGFVVQGEPRLVNQRCYFSCAIWNPQWEVPTADGKSLYVVFDSTSDTPVIFTSWAEKIYP